MRTRRQAEVVGACVLVCESACLLLLIIMCRDCVRVSIRVYTPKAIYRYTVSGARRRAALEPVGRAHFDVGH